MKFFWEERKILKRENELCRAKIKELEDKIKRLENELQAVKDRQDPVSIATVRTYQRFLNQLRNRAKCSCSK